MLFYPGELIYRIALKLSQTYLLYSNRVHIMNLSNMGNKHTIHILLYLVISLAVFPLQAQDTILPYRLKPAGEVALLTTAFGTGISAIVIEQKSPLLTAADLEGLGPEDIHPFDRSAVYNFSRGADLGSDILVGALFAAPGIAAPILNHWDRRNTLILYLLYAEAIGLNGSINLMVKELSDRKRPLLFNPGLTEEQKLEGRHKNLKSFYSGHTSTAFTAAVFLSKMYHDLRPRSTSRAWIWAISLVMAGTVGYFRYEAGKHFPTDVITGAVMGSFFGYGIPALHKISQRSDHFSFQPLIGPFRGFAISYHW